MIHFKFQFPPIFQNAPPLFQHFQKLSVSAEDQHMLAELLVYRREPHLAPPHKLNWEADYHEAYINVICYLCTARNKGILENIGVYSSERKSPPFIFQNNTQTEKHDKILDYKAVNFKL